MESGEWDNLPGGCYAENNKAWFNRQGGAAHKLFKRLCRTVPPELPAGVPKGPYAVKATRYDDVEGMDKANKGIDVWYPIGTPGQKFPLIAYAHGYSNGGKTLANVYDNHLRELAAFGYIIAAAEACDVACSDLASLPGDPAGFKHYYEQQLKVLEWARQSAVVGDTVLSAMDLDIGVGIAGHSMGGQSTLFSAGEGALANYSIKAAVMHHAYTHTYPAPTVPFLAFTGTEDTVASPSSTEKFYNADGAHPIRGIVNKVGMCHGEPGTACFNPVLASLTAAWFKLYLDETPQVDQVDYHELIFSKMCDGQYDGEMKQCEVHDGTTSLVV